jgi:anti-sigma B factor antagonist
VSNPTPRGLRCHIEPDRERVVVRAVGEVDLATVGLLEQPLIELLDSGFAEIVVNLWEVTFMDSTGLHLLVSVWRRAQDQGVELRFDVDSQGAVQRVLELTGLRELLPIASSDRVRSAAQGVGPAG